MSWIESECPEAILSVRAAVSLFGERSQRGKLHKNKDQLSIPEDLPIHFARRDTASLSNGTQSVEKEMARAKSELSDTKKTAEELSLRIIESRLRSKAKKEDTDMLKKTIVREEERAWTNGVMGDDQYMEVFRDIENVKQELGNLKLGIESLIETKAKKDEETKSLSLKMESCLKSMEELEKEIEEVNEEHMLVELARIEASKEYREIEVQRKTEAQCFSRKMEEDKVRINDLIKEISCAEELDMKLANTKLDINVLQNEMVFVRSMVKNLGSNKSSVQKNKKKEEKMEAVRSLQQAEAELEEAKQELISIKEEGFGFMASMDVVREEMKIVSNEVCRLRKLQEKGDITVQNLNSKLQRAKSKLVAALEAERKFKAIVVNLSEAIQRLRREMEDTKKEKEKITTETDNLKLKVEKTDSHVDGMKERLLTAMHELEVVKASEAVILARLRAISENMSIGASPLQLRKTITISNFEYEYLIMGAEEAQEVADKKVVAAQAWVEAFKSSEKEAQLQTEIAKREIQEICELEEKEYRRLEEALMKETRDCHKRSQLENELQAEESQPQMSPPSKSFKGTSVSQSLRRSKIHRKSISPGLVLLDETEEQRNRVLDSEPQAVNSKLMLTPPRKSFKKNGVAPLRKFRRNRRSSSYGSWMLIRSPSTGGRKGGR